MKFTITRLRETSETLNIVDTEKPKNTITSSKFKESYLFCLEMGWIEDKQGKLYLTTRGKEIVNARSPKHLRLQIEDFIRITQPHWAHDLHQGITHAKFALFPQIFTIFKEAKLMEKSIEKMEWLDKFIIPYYSELNAKRLENGRTGERLIYDDEKKRVGITPEYCGDIEKLGYDIKSSRKVNGANKNILIEVKAGDNKLKNINFHLSRNQWSTAFSHEHTDEDYFVFVVSIPEKKYLQISPQMLKPYVPPFPRKHTVDWGEIVIKVKNIFEDCESDNINLDKNIIDLL